MSCITESWCTPNVTDNAIALTNFKLVRNDRGIISSDLHRYVQEGGIACYIRDTLVYKL